uniref:T4 RNA ligase 1-like N-terminal domain-containing protein n=1 Tax=viral metagenome TaxID=1070528 RepID=A0A6C0E6C1_9ZZZZ
MSATVLPRTIADGIHQIYMTSKKDNKSASLGPGESIITNSNSTEKITLNQKSSGTLTPKDGASCPVVKEFLSFDKKSRSDGNTIGSLKLSDGRFVEFFMMTLNKDEDYLRCTHLFRCHALIRITNLDGTYQYYDSGAHRKFYNIDTPSDPDTIASNIISKKSSIEMVEVHEKVSGSQILCLVAPPELQDHFLFMFFSKRGTSNMYSDLGCTAFKAYVEKKGHTMDQLYQNLVKRNITSMTFEVMGVDRHVSMDAGDKVGSLIMHGVSLKDGLKMPLEEMETFGVEFGFDVVKLLFRMSGPDSFEKALKVCQNYDCEGNTNEGGVITIHYTDHTTMKLKYKTWWYLYLREFRQCISDGSKSEIVPTLDGHMSRLKMFGAPENLHLRLAKHYVLWWLWVRSNQCTSDFIGKLNDGDHPVVIEHFMNLKQYRDLDNYTTHYNTLLMDQRGKPVLIPLGINVGLMGSGKSTTSKEFAVVISQDQCGGDRKKLVETCIQYFVNTKGPLILDRTNLNVELRNTLLWDFANALGRLKKSKDNLLVVPFFVCHGITDAVQGQIPNVILDRILQNRQTKDSHESLTLEGTGTLTVIEILRNASSQLVFPTEPSEMIFLDLENSIDVKVNSVRTWFNARYTGTSLMNKFDNAPEPYKLPNVTDQKNKKSKAIYAGYSTPYHNLTSTPSLKDHFEKFLETNPDATQHNTHITMAYGAKMAQWPHEEGKPKKLSWIGTFVKDDVVCGSIILDVDPASFTDLNTLPSTTLVYHVTGWTAQGVQPVESNTVLNSVTNTTTPDEKPHLHSLLKLFEKSNTYQNTRDGITLTLFDTPKTVQGYEGTYCRT